MQKDAAAAWDQHVPAYARLFEPLTGYIARAMLHLVESRLPPRAALLDIACGSGALALVASFALFLVAYVQVSGLRADREAWEEVTYEERHAPISFLQPAQVAR